MIFQEERNVDLPAIEAELGISPEPTTESPFALGGRLTSFEEINLDEAVQAVSGVGTDPGLGLLVDLAKKGEYDPWNVDIVALTDSYLDALDDTLDAQDLSRVARMIFYAAALIHLKAKALAAGQKSLDYDEALEQALHDEFDDGFGGPQSRLRPGDMPLDYGFMADLDKGSPIGLAPQDRPVRQRGLSLVDLIVALREYDERLAQREAALDDEPEAFTDEMVYEECLGGSHQEDTTQDIVDVRATLWVTLPDVESVTLESLCTETLTRGSAFLALLFLSNDEEVYLEQDEFFEEVRIVKGPFFGEIVAGVVSDDDEDEEESEGGYA